MPETSLKTIPLAGCRPEPIASYLKSLGVLRVVADPEIGLDPTARSLWKDGAFHLVTSRGADELRSFLLERYRPAAVVAPWNGGSGFFSKDNTKAIEAIESGTADRFAEYRCVIAGCRGVLDSMQLDAKPSGDEKEKLLTGCRNSLPDRALSWFDAAVMLTGEGPKFPPLLGTGGNDGRLEFSNNFMQRLTELFDPNSGEPTKSAAAWLDEALFAIPADGLQSVAVGQFDPGNAGGANASSDGFDGRSTVNPWDFVLMIEGTLLFAGSVGRRLERAGGGVLCYPFCVRQSGAGYGSAADSDEKDSRAELWAPLWDRPSGLPELSALFAEGRAEVGRRRAVSGVDFARGVAALGVDRGVSEFVRYGFQVRNGLSYFAVPLGRFRVGANPRVSLLNEGTIDAWLSRFDRASDAPARVRRARRQLEEALLKLAVQDDTRRWQDALIALGEAEAALAVSASWRENKIRPVPPLSSEWLDRTNDDTPEFRLAAALAGISPRDRHDAPPLRCHLEPVETGFRQGRQDKKHLWVNWKETADRDIVWGGSTLVENLCRVLERRVLTAERSTDTNGRPPFPGYGRVAASLADIVAFIERRTDDARIEALLKGLILLDWPAVESAPWKVESDPHGPVPVEYALLKLCHANHRIKDKDAADQPRAVRLDPAISRLAVADRLRDATVRAAGRLRAMNLAPMIGGIDRKNDDRSRRVAAALLFPLSEPDQWRLVRQIIEPRKLQPSAAGLDKLEDLVTD